MKRGLSAVSILVAACALGLAPAAHALDIDLRTNTGFIVWGAESFDATGRAVAMGDLDGDGFRDIIIGSIGVDGAGNVVPNSGAVDIIWGDTRANLGASKDLLTDSDVHIDGADTGDQVGIFVVSGDFDDDGRADLAIGGALGDGPGNIRADAGDVYIFYGRDRASWELLTSVSQRDVVIYGADPGDQSGISLAVGDIDNDGADDLLIGGSNMDGPANARNGAGGVHLWWGGPRPEGGAVDLGSIVLFDGADANDLAGRSLAAGDLDGDGMDDVIIGIPNSSGLGNARAQSGEVAVVWGRSKIAMGSYRDLATDADYVAYGAETGDNLGTSVWAANHNGDAFDDLLMGAPLGDAPGNSRVNAGETYMLYGQARAGWGASRDMAGGISGVGKAFIGEGAGDLLGNALTGGDLDGDGSDEIVLGATLADGVGNGRLSSGEMYLYFGALPGSFADSSTVGPGSPVRILGADAGDRQGTIMSMGDLDMDGGLELAMGGPGGDSNGNGRLDGGEVAILYGFGQVVPALLVDLEVETESGGAAVITWSTLQQDQVRGFNIYRVVGAGAYERANPELISALSGTAGSYRWVDTGAHAGVQGYEIRQVDRRGQESFLGLAGYTPAGATVEFAIRNLASPFTGSSTFALSLPARFQGQPYRVAMFDNAGRLVKSLASGTVAGSSVDVRLDASNLRAGVYHLRVVAGAEAITTKVVKL